MVLTEGYRLAVFEWDRKVLMIFLKFLSILESWNGRVWNINLIFYLYGYIYNKWINKINLYIRMYILNKHLIIILFSKSIIISNQSISWAYFLIVSVTIDPSITVTWGTLFTTWGLILSFVCSPYTGLPQSKMFLSSDKSASFETSSQIFILLLEMKRVVNAVQGCRPSNLSIEL